MAIEKRTGNETPRPVLGKTAKSQRVVRFVDLNDSLNKIEEAFVPLPANPSNGDALVYNSTTGLWEAGAVSDPTLQTAVVEISSAEILTMGTIPIELLPLAGVDKYYDISSIILEFTQGTITYNNNFAGPLKIVSSDNYHWIFISDGLLNEGTDTLSVVDGKSMQYKLETTSNEGVEYGYVPKNMAYYLTNRNAAERLLGDGTMRAIITYRVRTFGE